MPLTQFTVVTGIGTTFVIAWALLKDETEPSYAWALSKLQVFSMTDGIERPFVVISDYEQAFLNACRSVFSFDVSLQICVWHVMKNVAYNVKVKCVTYTYYIIGTHYYK